MIVVLDSAALSAVARRDRAAHPVLQAILTADHRVVVPAVVLAEVMTGKPTDAAVWHVVNRMVVQDVTASIAARAGALRERAAGQRVKKRDLTVDALVAATAEALAPSTIVTADAGDLLLLTSDSRVSVAQLR